MSALAQEIAALVVAEGPIPLSRYMALCLTHPVYGYYTMREPFGVGGDFVTAPEIHQVFGELLGGWIGATFLSMGAPKGLTIVELGPGRGTMLADAWRAARRAPGLAEAASIALIEASPTLAMIQSDRLSPLGVPLSWCADLADVPEGPTILIANEFLDALPIRQFIMTERGFRERVVGLVEGRLAFGLAPDPVPPGALPAFASAAQPGDVVEVRPGLQTMVAVLARRAAHSPLAALFIDYGHAISGFGDTFQALKAHRFVDPLDAPGEADLTAHVDFADMARLARAAGLAVSRAATQRELLFRLGLRERAERLALASPRGASALKAAVDRLIDPAPAGMGQLFKAIVISSPGLVVPAFEVAGE